MADSEGGHSWARVIPEFYYDMIARIPAGLVLVLFVLWIISPSFLIFPNDNSLKIEMIKSIFSWAPATLALIFILVFSYTCGLFLASFGSLLSKLYQPYIWKKVMGEKVPEEGSRRLKYKQLMEEKKYNQSDLDWMDREIHFFLKATNKQALTVLPKMRAEAGLAANTTAAAVFSFFFYLIWSISLGDPLLKNKPFLIVVALITILSAVSIPFRLRSYCRVQLAFLDMVEFKNKDVIAQGEGEKNNAQQTNAVDSQGG